MIQNTIQLGSMFSMDTVIIYMLTSITIITVILLYMRVISKEKGKLITQKKYCVLYSFEENVQQGNLEFYFTNEEMKQVSFELLSEKEEFLELIKEGQFKPGGHIIRFDSTKIKNGVYFYQLRTDNQIIKKKMVVDNLAV
jgi:hypothetical protein